MRIAISARRAALAAAMPIICACADAEVPELGYRLARTLPHDPAAYTQGLVLHEGAFLESTGQYGESQLRLVEVATGRVLRSVDLAADLFGEGLAVVGDRAIQLTWQAGLAFVYDLESFAVTDTLEYEGEGWGLCHDGASLYQSDGSGVLFRRDPATFALLEELRVTRGGFSTRGLNELECVGDEIYANIYMTNEIVRIDKATGAVNGSLDGLALAVSSDRPNDPGAVFNGIAYDESSGNFFVTGKLWPEIFEIVIEG